MERENNYLELVQVVHVDAVELVAARQPLPVARDGQRADQACSNTSTRQVRIRLFAAAAFDC